MEKILSLLLFQGNQEKKFYQTKLHTNVGNKFAFKRNVGQEFTFILDRHKKPPKIVSAFLYETSMNCKCFLRLPIIFFTDMLLKSEIV